MVVFVVAKADEKLWLVVVAVRTADRLALAYHPAAQ